MNKTPQVAGIVRELAKMGLYRDDKVLKATNYLAAPFQVLPEDFPVLWLMQFPGESTAAS